MVDVNVTNSNATCFDKGDIHNWLLTHEQAKKINPNASDLCPICVTIAETSTHLFHCMHGSAICACTEAIIQFCVDLYSLKTAQILKQVLVYKVAQWWGIQLPCPKIPSNFIGDLISEAVEQQNNIGWDNFLKGCLSILWDKAQLKYHKHRPSTIAFLPQHWAKGVISATWHMFTK
eukprot:9887752-Ditylum_brightwellii.AAC.1